ncbi:MAG TPA: crossover junction endodeoxyribonuclease RuvC [Candidatus Cloacimonetes bacterium]|nr:crossover junction endodeoxyribonuclease RuvC [Candidatus Cloacimonadota bacterium]
MIIIGVDPGSKYCGYGIIEVQKNRILAAGCDVIKIKQSFTFPEKLTVVYTEIKQIIAKYKPDIAAVESIFYGKNIKSAFILGHVRGVILLALAEQNIKVLEYSPREIKRSVVGNGNASKEQVQYMVQKILNLNLENRSEDAMDALAIALCQFNKERFRSR